MNKKKNYPKYIAYILFAFIFIRVTNTESYALRLCPVPDGEPGCCTYDECGDWVFRCNYSEETVPTTCNAEPGYCECDRDWYCNSTPVGMCSVFPKYQCDTCCCTLDGGGGGVNSWYGVMGQVVRQSDGQYYRGAPFEPYDGRCGTASPQNDYSITVNGENIARVWWCDSDEIVRYYSHHNDNPGWTNLNAGMTRGQYYTATLGNLPSGSSCGTWTVYNSDGSFQGDGTGCNASFLFTTVNNYMRIDWTVGSACVPVNGTLSAFGTCSPSCGPGTQTATCTQEASCGGTDCSTLCTNAGGTYSGTTCTKDCDLGPCNPAPIGWHDGSTCISTNGPDLRKINSVGWTCDQSDYPTSLNVHLYLDGPAGSGTFIGSALANIDRAGTGSYCGNTISHGFNYTTTGSFPSGTHTVYSYAIDIPNGTPNPLLSGSPKTVSCCSAANGSLGQWGSCSGGSQTSPCNGFSCGGSCSVECGSAGGTYDSSTNICTRACLYVEGNIWSDDNGNTVKDNSEKWRDVTYLSGCSTSKVHPSFTLNYTGETGNQIKGWWCHVTAGAYYRGSTGVAANIEPGQPHTFTLSDWPDGYKPKSWVYNHPGYSTSGDWSGLGPFSTSSIIMPTSGWTNVHWELQQQKYNLTIKVKDIPPETPIEYSGDSCTLDLSVLDNLSDATVIISSATGAELCNKTTDPNGEVTCGIWVNQGDLNITVRKRVSDEEVIRTYNMVCPSKSNSFIYNPGDVTDGDSKTELVGLQESYKESWVSAVDSDIFANEVDVTIPLGTGSNPAGYVKALLNSFNNITGGFVFSNDQVLSPSENTEDEGTIYNLLFEDDLGGRAENLDSGGFNHNSKWLESFTFEAPANATEISNFTASLDSGVIYKGSEITTLPTTYALSGTGVAVLYIDNDLTINNDFTTSSNGRLLLVVNGSVTISEGVGTDVSSFMLSQDPNIEAGIIASGKIEFESIGGSIAEDSHDDPIMVSAPLITRDLTDGIIFSRDLYTDNNVTTPAESAKAFNKYLYLLSSLEREKSQDNLYFTGVTTYDLDWEYIY